MTNGYTAKRFAAVVAAPKSDVNDGYCLANTKRC